MSPVPGDRLFEELAALLPPAGASRAGDDALMARAVEGALGAPMPALVRVPRQERGLLAEPRRRWATTAGLVAATLLLAGTAAAYLAPRAPRPLLLPIRVGVGESMAGASRGALAALEPARPSDAPRQVAETEPAVVPEPRASAAAASAAHTAARPTVAEPAATDDAPPPEAVAALPAESAAQLFARANAARRQGDVPGALAAYRRLQATYPASAEASLSHVAVGRALLDGGGSASEALVAFDGYLARGGPLAEEALVGRALALGKLGRAGDERRAWETLLARFPLSISGSRARARLAELP